MTDRLALKQNRAVAVHRAAAIMILAGLILIPILLGLWAWQARTAAADALAQKAGQLARLEAIVRQKADVERWAAEHAAGRASASPSAATLRSANPALAAAGLQTTLAAAAQRHGIAVASFRGLPVGDGKGLTEIGLEVAGSGSFAALVGLLSEIEGGPADLTAAALQVRAQPGAAAFDPGTAGSGADPQLAVTLAVRGWVAGAPASSSAATPPALP